MYLSRKFIFSIVSRKFSKSSFIKQSFVRISEEVSESLKYGKPVVALESTIITHGMPFPRNLETALEVEKIIRDHNAVPATISVINGKINVGTGQRDLEMLAEKSSKTVKVSRRDFSRVMAAKLNGGTTVAGTMVIADKVGIRVFVTGGIGGVHRGGENTMDVSADLVELGRTPVCVVSSGVKSILDIGRTLEFLETQGVCVATYGPNGEFPAFYTRSSGFKSPYWTDSVDEAASMLKSTVDLNLNSGLLIAVPIPEEYAMNEREMEAAIRKALTDAEGRGIKGKEVTPFILSAVANITGGKSLEANVALIKNNAKVGARIAVSYSNMKNRERNTSSSEETFTEDTYRGFPHHGAHRDEISPVIIGGSNVDSTIKVLEDNIKMDGTTHVSEVVKSWGGVGRNIADCLSKLGANPILLTSLGEDYYDARGKLCNFECRCPIPKSGSISASYTAILDKNGECQIGFGDMAIHDTITPEWILQNVNVLKNAPLIVIDGNISIPTMDCILKIAEDNNVPVFFEPTDIRKAIKPFKTNHWKAIKFITPNINELKSISNELNYKDEILPVNHLEKARKLLFHIGDLIDNLLITLGENGVLLATKKQPYLPFFTKQKNKLLYSITPNNHIQYRHYPVNDVVKIINVSGAGDCLAAALIYSMLNAVNEDICISVAFAAAQTSLLSEEAVPKFLFDKQHKSWRQNVTFKII